MHPEVVVPLAGIALPLFLVPTIIAMKHARLKREWEHLERMKAMELGRPVPSALGDDAWPAMVAIGLGAVMPVGVFVVTWLASLTAHLDGEVFVAPLLVGVAGVLGGTTLGHRLLTARERSRADSASNAKPAYDPDAFDVVGR
ncbi:MAG TPA: hypothetical protein VG406_08775 [Isosphaeraceae bacterium]|jgi:hypothetical protein|nr:hypothetical protein [Isosphaeraceae bacterium]